MRSEAGGNSFRVREKGGEKAKVESSRKKETGQ